MRREHTYLVNLDQMELPTTIQLGENLFAAVFVLMKLILARDLIRSAQKKNLIGSGGHVVETTSGSMGLALAYACRESGHRLSLVSDPIIDEGLRIKLENLGARLVTVTKPLSRGGFQAARLRKLHELMEKTPQTYWTRQYDNSDAPDAYRRAARRIAAMAGKVDFLVASVSSGSSATGLAKWLQKAGHEARLIAVDTHHSVLFGQSDGRRIIRGLGNSIIPKNLDYNLVYQCHWVTAAEAFLMMRKLFSAHLLDVGPTSGATYLVARWIAKQNPDKRVVFVCADSGERYRLTAHNPQWLARQRAFVEWVPQQPRLIAEQNKAEERWSYMKWAGRSLSDVVRGESATDDARSI